MVEGGRNDEAVFMISQLAKLFRISLSQGRTVISVKAVSYTHLAKKVWLDIYNSSDNFLGSTYQPLLQKYDKLLNLDVDYIGGDGQTESNITNRLGNPSQYDAFAINMVKTDNAASYTSPVSYTHLDVYKRQGMIRIKQLYILILREVNKSHHYFTLFIFFS